MEKLECKTCGNTFSSPAAGNAIYLCPKCKAYVSCICDYGFGPITPCSIFLGEEEIATIIEPERLKYKLHSDELGIDIMLTKGYKNLEVYKEASSIIDEALKR
ncbi:MAG: hypothetical protein J6P79_11005 [Pseudobutyrivibrio sp.]|nr:hypothetical protein [Pseudobutyrivibrio sp.]